MHVRSFVAGALVVGVTLWLTSLTTAQAEAPRVYCAAIEQGITGVDPAKTAKQIADHLAAGREHIHTVQGNSTVLCAW